MAQNSEKKDRLPVFRQRLNELIGEMSTTEFAEKVGLSRQTMGFYLNGDRIPDAETLLKICEKCSVPSDWLLGITNDRNRKPAAVDELGLSPKVVHYIKLSKEWSKDEEFTNEQLNEQVKSCIYDNCYSTHGAFNMVLERTINSTIYAMIAQLARQIDDIEGTVLPDDLLPHDSLVKRIGKVAAQSASAGAKLTCELYNLHPELAGFFRVVYGAEELSIEIDRICADFRKIVEEITGYSEYVSGK